MSLDGKINRINGILPMCIEAKKLGIKTLIVPKENAKEAAIVKEMEVLGATNLKQVVEYLNKEKEKVEILIYFLYPQILQYFRRVGVGLGLGEYLFHDALGGDDKGAADHSHGHLAVELFLLPHPKGLYGGKVGV